VRVIGEKGENLGILPLEKALSLARPEEGLDLIEIASSAKPPVCRLMSFDKYRYLEEKKEKKERAAQKSAELKQIQISARAAEHDLLIKIRQLEKFLEEGLQVEIKMRLRGREKFHKEWARQKLEEFLKMITIEYKLITPPKFSGLGIIAQLTKK
jgi:translation initiation factor IF-3